MRAERAVLTKTYEAFNRRDMAGLGATLHPDVEWPDILEGGVVSGREAVLDYFARQLEVMVPDARLIRVRNQPPARLVAEVQYSVRSLKGKLWSDTRATLAYDFRDGLIVRLSVIEGL